MNATTRFSRLVPKPAESKYMVHTPLFVTAVLVIVAFASSSAHAQDYLSGSGIPTFVSPQPVEQGFVDASNGNLHLQFTFGSYPQRGSGQPYSVNYVYDSDMLWNIGCSGSSCSWAPSNYNNYGWRLGTNGGTLTGLNCTTSCEEWVFTDPLGTTHYFPVSTGSCPIPNAYASDSSGYMLNLCQTGVYAPDGTLVYSATYEQPVSPGAEDSNGNYISWGTGGLGGSTDTAGRAVPSLAISNCNGNAAETCYQVPNAQGATSTYTITTATIPVQTDFQQSGVSEFSGTSLWSRASPNPMEPPRRSNRLRLGHRECRVRLAVQSGCLLRRPHEHDASHRRNGQLFVHNLQRFLQQQDRMALFALLTERKLVVCSSGGIELQRDAGRLSAEGDRDTAQWRAHSHHIHSEQWRLAGRDPGV